MYKNLYVHMAIAVCAVASLVTVVVTLCIPFVVNKFSVLGLSANYMYTTAPSQRLGTSIHLGGGAVLRSKFYYDQEEVLTPF